MPERPLHIAIDGRELTGRATGVGRYLQEFLRVWANRPAGHRYTVILPSAPTPEFRALGDRLTWRVEPAASAGTWWEQTRLRRALRDERPDVFFAVGYTAPLRLPCPFVVTVHDVSFWAHPEWFSAREGWRRRWLTRAAARRASRVLTVSEFSACEIVRHLGVPRSKILLAPPGAPAADAGNAGPRESLVLSVGSLFNRRRVPDLIRAFARTAAALPDARLVLVGDDRSVPRIDPMALAADLGIGDRVDWRQYVDDAELHALYRRARVFAFLSQYEGFAMTPLEAIAHGAPPVLLDTAVAREIYADAAVYVAPGPAAASEAMTRLLTDEGLRTTLLAAGRRRLDEYSWSRSAQVTLRALEEAAR